MILVEEVWYVSRAFMDMSFVIKDKPGVEEVIQSEKCLLPKHKDPSLILRTHTSMLMCVCVCGGVWGNGSVVKLHALSSILSSAFQ